MLITTVKEWLGKLPEPIRTQALNNSSNTMLEARRSSLQIALDSAFIWENTAQGHGYWEAIHTQLCLEN